MKRLYPHQTRGHVKQQWLDTYHSFSFGQWYDPNFLGASQLRVINEDTIAPHFGFGTHAHDNMEILTYVLSGSISHKDSMGNAGKITQGEWQLMSAGSGVKHSEINEENEPVHLLQIWIHPNVRDAEPNYQQLNLDPQTQPNQWHTIASANDGMHIRQDAKIQVAFLNQDQSLKITNQYGSNYIHLISGNVTIDGQILTTGDAIHFDQNANLVAHQDSQILWFDLP